MVLRRSPHLPGVEPFYSEFIAGMEDALRDSGDSVVLHIVPGLEEELESYRRWAASGHVSAVVVRDIVAGDVRAEVLRGLGLPVLVLGDPGYTEGEGIATLQVDNFGAMTQAVEFAVGLGHRVIGRVAGPAHLLHTGVRSRSFQEAVAAHDVIGLTAVGDYSEVSGSLAVEKLWRDPHRPTMIIFDNDAMAVGGLGFAIRNGVRVPDELSMLAWDDSILCRLSEPALSAMRRDIHALGATAVDIVGELLAGRSPVARLAPLPRLIVRGTTGSPPRR